MEELCSYHVFGDFINASDGVLVMALLASYLSYYWMDGWR